MIRAIGNVALSLLLTLGTAQAATVTFANLTDPMATSFVEDGVTVTGNGHILPYGAGHIDDSGTSAPSRLTFTMNGLFNAISFDLNPVGFHFEFCRDVGTWVCTRPTYTNVSVQGFRGGNLVSSLLFDMGTAGGWQTILLGSSFANLTSLTIGVVLPDAFFPTGPGYSLNCPNPCSHFNLDNIVLAPVPLVATAPLAASGFSLLALLGMRRRKRRH